MPQRPTTHKDLHRATVVSLVLLAYLLAIQGAWAENSPHTASSGLSTKTEQTRLVKNEPTKPTAAPAKLKAPEKTVTLGKAVTPPTSVAAPMKPIASPTALVPVPEVKPPQPKVGKLREIPPSTLNGDKAVSTQTKVNVETNPDGKSSARTDSASNNKTDSTAKKKESATAKKTTDTKAKKTTASVPRLNNGLIPPPPPIVPFGMDVLGMYAQPVDYLSMKDLEARKKELSVRFNELDSIVSDGQRQIKERKERAELFESLYQEGVVSRKELEIAKREAGEIDRDFKFKQDELDSVKVSMKAVNNRLAVLKKMEAKMNAGKQKAKKSTAVVRNKSTQND